MKKVICILFVFLIMTIYAEPLKQGDSTTMWQLDSVHFGWTTPSTFILMEVQKTGAKMSATYKHYQLVKTTKNDSLNLTKFLKWVESKIKKEPQ